MSRVNASARCGVEPVGYRGEFASEGSRGEDEGGGDACQGRRVEVGHVYLDRGGGDTAGVEHGRRDTANVEVEFAIAGGEAVQPGVYHRTVKLATTGRGVLGEAG
jgi:hypothetical protein